MNAKSLCLVFVLFSATQAFAWTDGELLIWISSNRPFHALSDIGKIFEKEVGAPVKVETQEKIIDNFQAAAQSGKGPDISVEHNVIPLDGADVFQKGET